MNPVLRVTQGGQPEERRTNADTPVEPFTAHQTILAATIALVAVGAISAFQTYLNAPYDYEILKPECQASYSITGRPSLISTALEPYRASFVSDYLGGSENAQLIVTVIQRAMTYLGLLTSNWMNFTHIDRQLPQKEFAETLDKTLYGSYKIKENPSMSTNYTQLLKNRLGTNLAIIKRDIWQERFIREFNFDRFLSFPRIASVEIPTLSKSQSLAIEFLHGAKQDFKIKFGLDGPSYPIYSYLSMTDLGHALNQRQRIFILDVLTQNIDRHDKNLLVGCRQGHVALHPIDHDGLMTHYRPATHERIKGPFYTSRFSKENQKFIQSLTFSKLDQIFENYKIDIERDAHWYVPLANANRVERQPATDRKTYIKLLSVLLRMASENGMDMYAITMLVMQHFDNVLTRYLSDPTELKRTFFEQGYAEEEAEVRVREWINTNLHWVLR